MDFIGELYSNFSPLQKDSFGLLHALVRSLVNLFFLMNFSLLSGTILGAVYIQVLEGGARRSLLSSCEFYISIYFHKTA